MGTESWLGRGGGVHDRGRGSVWEDEKVLDITVLTPLMVRRVNFMYMYFTTIF